VAPEDFARQVLDRAGDRQIFFVYSTNYRTHQDLCPAIYNALGVERVPEVLTQPSDAYEWASVVRFTPRTP